MVASGNICGAITGLFDKALWHFDITKDCVNTIDIKAWQTVTQDSTRILFLGEVGNRLTVRA